MQDKEYSFQLAQKKISVIEAFARTGVGLETEPSVFFKDPYGYRSRMDFVMASEGPGFRQKGRFYKLVNIEGCPISNSGLNAVFHEVKAWYRANREKIELFDVVKKKGCLRYSVVRSAFFTGESCVTFILNSDSDALNSHLALLRDFAASSKVANVLWGGVKRNSDVSVPESAEVIKGKDMLSEIVSGVRLNYHSQGFFQNNTPMICDVIHYIKEKAGAGYDVVFDLFGGVGTFGLHLKDAGSRVIIADSDAKSIECAGMNIRENGVANAEAVCVDAAALDGLKGCFSGKKSLFVIDPPRNGMHKKTIRFIKETAPDKMIYISCGPVRQAEDIKALAGDYVLESLAVFDLFPQTHHVETAAVLVKKKNGIILEER